MLLQVLINHHDEPEETVAPLLRSLASQERVPWGEVEMLMCSDGTEHALSKGFIDSFGIPIRYRAIGHKGLCHARNVLMDEAEADYIMFCDCDDRFHSTLGIYRVLKAIGDVGTDIIAAPYEIESEHGFHTERKDTIHVFSKAYRRSYLVDNGIRFPDDMETCGDMRFMWLAFNLNPTIAWTNESFYVWADNPESVTRKSTWHRVESYGKVMACYEGLYQELLARGRDDLRDRLVAALFAMAYDHCHDERYTEAPTANVMYAEVDGLLGRHMDEYRDIGRDVKASALRERGMPDVDAMEEWVYNRNRTDVR